MTNQIFFEDLNEGTLIPPLKKNPTTQQLVKYAGASGDFYQIHYDQDYAKSNGLPTVIIHGALKNAWFGQIITDWIGLSGQLKELSVQYRGMDIPGSPLTIQGKILRKWVDNGQYLVEVELWLENFNGERTTKGSAKFSLESKTK